MSLFHDECSSNLAGTLVEYKRGRRGEVIPSAPISTSSLAGNATTTYHQQTNFESVDHILHGGLRNIVLRKTDSSVDSKNTEHPGASVMRHCLINICLFRNQR